MESCSTCVSKVRGKTSNVSPEVTLSYIIALGSNLNFQDDVSSTLLDGALVALKKRDFMIRSISRYFRTPAFPSGSGPDFVNAAAVVEFAGSAAQALEQMHAVEAQMGRERAVRWGARTLDLDLIGAGVQVLPDVKTYEYWRDLPLEMQKTSVPPELIVPHPRLADRSFVLVPLLDVAPDWRHPVSGESVREMHDALSARARSEVVAL